MAVPSVAAAGQYIVILKPGGGQQLARDVARSSYVTHFERMPGDARLATVHVRGNHSGVLAKLRAHPDVQLVEEDRVRTLAWAPRDPLFVRSANARKGQWHLPRIGAHWAWNLKESGFTGQGATIAIIDSGVDSTHPDLQGKVMRGFNPAVPRKAGARFRHNTEDMHGHGTHVAGIAAATASNRTGGVGVAPQARILPVKVDVNGIEGIRASDVAAAIRWASDRGADVINLSLGGEGRTKAESRALRYAAKRGVVVVCAAGNNGARGVDFPARDPRCLAVGASNRKDRRAGFSNYGKGLDLLAPGVGIISTVPRNGGYARWDGTSMAAPVVSGTAALLAARGLGRAKIIRTLKKTARDRGRTGWDPQHGHGRVNALKALRSTRWKGYKTNARPKCPAETHTVAVTIASGRDAFVPMMCSDRQDQQRIRYSFVDPSGTGGVTFRLASDHSYTGTVVVRRPAGSKTARVRMRASDGKATTPIWSLVLRPPTVKMPLKYAKKQASRAIKRRFSKVEWGTRACRRMGPPRVACTMEFLVGNRLYLGTSMVEFRRTSSGTVTSHMFEGEWIRFSCFFSGSSQCVRRVAFS